MLFKSYRCGCHIFTSGSRNQWRWSSLTERSLWVVPRCPPTDDPNMSTEVDRANLEKILVNIGEANSNTDECFKHL